MHEIKEEKSLGSSAASTSKGKEKHIFKVIFCTVLSLALYHQVILLLCLMWIVNLFECFVGFHSLIVWRLAFGQGILARAVFSLFTVSCLLACLHDAYSICMHMNVYIDFHSSLFSYLSILSVDWIVLHRSFPCIEFSLASQ